MIISKELNKNLDKLNLLKHPFYQAWNEGTLSIEVLQKYASEYYHHVAAFPHYINEIMSLCESKEDKEVLKGNLLDELGLKDSTSDFSMSDKDTWGQENHPELWLRFSEGIGSTRDIKDQPVLESTRALVNGYFDLVRKDYATGLGALYAYEEQTPEVSRSKIDGLKCNYGVSDAKTLKFFTVHQESDEWHREELEGLIAKLTTDEKKRFESGAIAGAKLLWGFLDGMNVTSCH